MNKKEPTREDARKILKKEILDMSVARLIQMSRYDLMGNITLSSELVLTDNSFNYINYDQESNVITFSVGEEAQDRYYGAISFSIDAITDISGCEDKENPDEYLNINIKLENGLNVDIQIMY